jgi:hypothetical protein
VLTEGESHSKAPEKTDPPFSDDQTISLANIFKSNSMSGNEHLLGYASTFSSSNISSQDGNKS